MEFYSDTQKEYWAQRPADLIHYEAVEFYNPDFGHIRLVANQYYDMPFLGNTYQAVSMELPSISSQKSDTTDAGSIKFGRIGTQVSAKLRQITPLGSMRNPINVKLFVFQKGILQPIYEKNLYVAKNGITLDLDSVNIKLSVDNPAKLTNKKAFYDPSEWLGLQSV